MKWEQTSDVIEMGNFFSRGSVDTEEINDLLTKRGAEGFELVSVVPIGDGNVGTRRIVLFFKRPMGA